MENLTAISDRMDKTEGKVSDAVDDEVSEDNTLRYSISARGKPYDLDIWLDNHSSTSKVLLEETTGHPKA